VICYGNSDWTEFASIARKSAVVCCGALCMAATEVELNGFITEWQLLPDLAVAIL
jgi:hypothetical protein